MYDAGSELTTVRALSPQSNAGGVAINGILTNRMGYNSLIATFITGAVTGAPTAVSAACKVQHGDALDGSDMSDISGATTTITGADLAGEINVDCHPLKKYVRVSVTVTFTGGTTPAILITAAITLAQTGLGPV